MQQYGIIYNFLQIEYILLTELVRDICFSYTCPRSHSEKMQQCFSKMETDYLISQIISGIIISLQHTEIVRAFLAEIIT
jgi:hypothetical protein